MAVPRESIAARRERTLRIIHALRLTYPDAHCELDFTNPLELLIATILSAQCTDRQVNIVTAGLFKKYRSAADYAQAPVEQLSDDIRRIGLFRNKARNIQACCRQLLDLHQGQVPQNLEALVALDGVGRKTANVVLGSAFQITSGIVVDTHVQRLSDRLGLSRASTAVAVEQDLMKLVPESHWIDFSHWLIWHGRRRCGARKPDCAQCEISSLCPGRNPTP
jgi:endonuclease-3